MPKVKGLDELRRNCSRRANSIGRIALDAVEDGAEIIADRARDIAPVDQGEFRRNIKVETLPLQRGVAEADVVVDQKDFASGFYPGHLEYGTSKMDAHPTIGPAFEETKETVEKLVQAKIRAGIERG